MLDSKLNTNTYMINCDFLKGHCKTIAKYFWFYIEKKLNGMLIVDELMT